MSDTHFCRRGVNNGDCRCDLCGVWVDTRDVGVSVDFGVGVGVDVMSGWLRSGNDRAARSDGERGAVGSRRENGTHVADVVNK